MKHSISLRCEEQIKYIVPDLMESWGLKAMQAK